MRVEVDHEIGRFVLQHPPGDAFVVVNEALHSVAEQAAERQNTFLFASPGEHDGKIGRAEKDPQA